MKKLLSNLSTLKAERTKYHFTVTLQDLQQFELGLKEVKGLDQDTTYCFLWKRGSKRNGKTENIPLKDGKLVWNSTFNVDITLFKEQKKGFMPKILELSLESTDKKNRKQILGKAEVNLSQYASEEEKKSQVPVILTIMKKPSKINLNIDSLPKKKVEGEELDSLSLMTDNEDDLESDNSNNNSMKKTSQTSIEQLNKIQELQNKIRELEAIKDPKSDKMIIIENLTKERDELKKKLKTFEGSLENTKIELERLQESSKVTDQKYFDIQLQLQKALQEVESSKNTSGGGSNIKITDLENELLSMSGRLRATEEKLKENETKYKDLQSNPAEKRVSELKTMLDEKTKQLNFLKKNDVLEEYNKMKKKYEDLKKNYDELSQKQTPTQGNDQNEKIEELTKELEELKLKNTEEVSHLKNELFISEENIKKLQEEKNSILENTTKTIDNFKEQEKKISNDFENEKKQLKQEIENLKKGSITSPKETKKVEVDINQFNELKSQNTKLDQKVVSLTQELEHIKVTIKEETKMKIQFENEKKELEKKLKENDSKKTTTSSDSERIKTLEKLNKELMNDIKKVGEEKKKLEEEISKKNVKESSTDFEKLIKEKESLISKEQEKSKGFEKKINEQENKIKELENKVKEVETKLKESEKKLTLVPVVTVDNKKDELEKKLKETETKLKEVETKLKESEKKPSPSPVDKDLEKKFKDSETKLNETDKKLKETETKLKETQNKLSETEKKVNNDNKKEKEEIEKKVKEIEVKFTTEQNKTKELEKKIKEYENKIGETDGLKQTIQTLQLTLENSKKTNEGNKEFDQLKKDMKILSLEITEKYLIDNSIVFLVPEYENNIPIYLKVLYLSLSKFKVFDPKQNLTFCENLIRAIDFSIDKDSTDHEKLVYWIHMLTRFYDLLKLDYPDQFKKVSFSNIQKSFKMNHKRPSPTYLSCLKGDIKRDSTENNIIKFIQDIFQSIVKSYYLLHSSLNEKLTKFMTVSIFEAKKEKVLSTIKSGDMNGAIDILNDFYNQLKKQNIDQKLIIHFFESEMLYLDTLIFNNLMRESNYTSLGIEIKMFLSILENWFDSKGVQMKFTHARQSADVCVIAEKSVLTDKSMRSAICPNLSIQQIGRLLSINSDDFGTKHRDLPKEIQEAMKQGNGNISTLLIQYQIEFEKSINGINYPNQKEIVPKIKLPERFTSISLLDYLK